MQAYIKLVDSRTVQKIKTFVKVLQPNNAIQKNF